MLCAAALVHAKADLDAPDKYLKSKQSAREAIESVPDVQLSKLFFGSLNELVIQYAADDEESSSAAAVEVGGKVVGKKRKR